MFRKLQVAAISALSLTTAFTTEIAYTQNNLPSQHKQTDMYPFIINADVLLAKVSVQGIVPLSYLLNTTNPTTTTAENFKMPNQAKVGVRAGLGVGLGNDFNISVQWTYLRSGDDFKRDFPLPNVGDIVRLSSLNASNPAFTSATAFVETYYTMHWLDLVLQAAKWMLTSHLRFQPFGGLRYFYFKNINEGSLDALPANQNSFSREFVVNKIHATGVFVGTDVKYLIQKWLHLYSVLYGGILAGNESQMSSVLENGIADTRATSSSLSFNPFFAVQFGLSTQFSLWNDSYMSLRIFYELFSITTDITLNRGSSLSQSVVYIQAQTGGLGFTIVF